MTSFANHVVRFQQKGSDTPTDPMLVNITHSSGIPAIAKRLGLTETDYVCRFDTVAVPFKVTANDKLIWVSGDHDDEDQPFAYNVTTVLPNAMFGTSVVVFQVSDFVDSATITRTSTTIGCIVDRDGRSVHLPEWNDVVFPLWKLAFPDGTDVRPQDEVVVEGKGTYGVYEVFSPTSQSSRVEVAAVLRKEADGSSALPTNQVVTFITGSVGRGTAIETIEDVDVQIYPAARDARINAYDTEFEWGIHFPVDLKFPTAGVIQKDDQLQWIDPNASDDEAAAGGRLFVLSYVSRNFGPLTHASGFFKEVAR